MYSMQMQLLRRPWTLSDTEWCGPWEAGNIICSRGYPELRARQQHHQCPRPGAARDLLFSCITGAVPSFFVHLRHHWSWALQSLASQTTAQMGWVSMLAQTGDLCSTQSIYAVPSLVSSTRHKSLFFSRCILGTDSYWQQLTRRSQWPS